MAAFFVPSSCWSAAHVYLLIGIVETLRALAVKLMKRDRGSIRRPSSQPVKSAEPDHAPECYAVAAVSLVEVSNLKFGYSNEPLFENVTFRLEAGERAGLVAPNGAGKSTLLRVIAGEVAPDSGSVVVKKGSEVGYYRQSHESKLEGSVRDSLLAGFGDIVGLRHALTEAQATAASGERQALERLAELTERYHHAGADALEHRVEAIATELGFRPSDLDRNVKMTDSTTPTYSPTAMRGPCFGASRTRYRPVAPGRGR